MNFFVLLLTLSKLFEQKKYVRHLLHWCQICIKSYWVHGSPSKTVIDLPFPLPEAPILEPVPFILVLNENGDHNREGWHLGVLLIKTEENACLEPSGTQNWIKASHLCRLHSSQRFHQCIQYILFCAHADSKQNTCGWHKSSKEMKDIYCSAPQQVHM